LGAPRERWLDQSIDTAAIFVRAACETCSAHSDEPVQPATFLLMIETPMTSKSSQRGFQELTMMNGLQDALEIADTV
jgi:hypothetical protein